MIQVFGRFLELLSGLHIQVARRILSRNPSRNSPGSEINKASTGAPKRNFKRRTPGPLDEAEPQGVNSKEKHPPQS